jgi:2-aminoethylphosphonate transport system permease protein
VNAQWNGILPSGLTLEHFVRLMCTDLASQLQVSMLISVVTSIVVIMSGTWAALAMRPMKKVSRRLFDMIFMLGVCLQYRLVWGSGGI